MKRQRAVQQRDVRLRRLATNYGAMLAVIAVVLAVAWATAQRGSPRYARCPARVVGDDAEPLRRKVTRYEYCFASAWAVRVEAAREGALEANNAECAAVAAAGTTLLAAESVHEAGLACATRAEAVARNQRHHDGEECYIWLDPDDAAATGLRRLWLGKPSPVFFTFSHVEAARVAGVANFRHWAFGIAICISVVVFFVIRGKAGA
eukprot:TRINITY_DN5449_c0_g1_i1.p1 TRINITY_DN5449_c0_g1~~TRINITY_DN5449_c0_g1_i1.p1  ORF type:complete len:206 (+),score=51.03 TRINITY_DN5449_c0_g1_i1:118-735(+)